MFQDIHREPESKQMLESIMAVQAETNALFMVPYVPILTSELNGGWTNSALHCSVGTIVY